MEVPLWMAGLRTSLKLEDDQIQLLWHLFQTHGIHSKEDLIQKQLPHLTGWQLKAATQLKENPLKPTIPISSSQEWNVLFSHHRVDPKDLECLATFIGRPRYALQDLTTSAESAAVYVGELQERRRRDPNFTSGFSEEFVLLLERQLRKLLAAYQVIDTFSIFEAHWAQFLQKVHSFFSKSTALESTVLVALDSLKMELEKIGKMLKHREKYSSIFSTSNVDEASLKNVLEKIKSYLEYQEQYRQLLSKYTRVHTPNSQLLVLNVSDNPFLAGSGLKFFRDLKMVNEDAIIVSFVGATGAGKSCTLANIIENPTHGRPWIGKHGSPWSTTDGLRLYPGFFSNDPRKYGFVDAEGYGGINSPAGSGYIETWRSDKALTGDALLNLIYLTSHVVVIVFDSSASIKQDLFSIWKNPLFPQRIAPQSRPSLLVVLNQQNRQTYDNLLPNFEETVRSNQQATINRYNLFPKCFEQIRFAMLPDCDTQNPASVKEYNSAIQILRGVIQDMVSYQTDLRSKAATNVPFHDWLDLVERVGLNYNRTLSIRQVLYDIQVPHHNALDQQALILISQSQHYLSCIVNSDQSVQDKIRLIEEFHENWVQFAKYVVDAIAFAVALELTRVGGLKKMGGSSEISSSAKARAAELLISVWEILKQYRPCQAVRTDRREYETNLSLRCIRCAADHSPLQEHRHIDSFTIDAARPFFAQWVQTPFARMVHKLTGFASPIDSIFPGAWEKYPDHSTRILMGKYQQRPAASNESIYAGEDPGAILPDLPTELNFDHPQSLSNWIQQRLSIYLGMTSGSLGMLAARRKRQALEFQQALVPPYPFPIKTLCPTCLQFPVTLAFLWCGHTICHICYTALASSDRIPAPPSDDDDDDVDSFVFTQPILDEDKPFRNSPPTPPHREIALTSVLSVNSNHTLPPFCPSCAGGSNNIPLSLVTRYSVESVISFFILDPFIQMKPQCTTQLRCPIGRSSLQQYLHSPECAALTIPSQFNRAPPEPTCVSPTACLSTLEHYPLTLPFIVVIGKVSSYFLEQTRAIFTPEPNQENQSILSENGLTTGFVFGLSQLAKNRASNQPNTIYPNVSSTFAVIHLSGVDTEDPETAHQIAWLESDDVTSVISREIPISLLRRALFVVWGSECSRSQRFDALHITQFSLATSPISSFQFWKQELLSKPSDLEQKCQNALQNTTISHPGLVQIFIQLGNSLRSQQQSRCNDLFWNFQELSDAHNALLEAGVQGIKPMIQTYISLIFNSLLVEDLFTFWKLPLSLDVVEMLKPYIIDLFQALPPAWSRISSSSDTEEYYQSFFNFVSHRCLNSNHQCDPDFLSKLRCAAFIDLRIPALLQQLRMVFIPAISRSVDPIESNRRLSVIAHSRMTYCIECWQSIAPTARSTPSSSSLHYRCEICNAIHADLAANESNPEAAIQILSDPLHDRVDLQKLVDFFRDVWKKKPVYADVQFRQAILDYPLVQAALNSNSISYSPLCLGHLVFRQPPLQSHATTSLTQLLLAENDPGFDLLTALDWMSYIAEGLGYLHFWGHPHCGVTPSKIYVTPAPSSDISQTVFLDSEPLQLQSPHPPNFTSLFKIEDSSNLTDSEFRKKMMLCDVYNFGLTLQILLQFFASPIPFHPPSLDELQRSCSNFPIPHPELELIIRSCLGVYEIPLSIDEVKKSLDNYIALRQKVQRISATPIKLSQNSGTSQFIEAFLEKYQQLRSGLESEPELLSGQICSHARRDIFDFISTASTEDDKILIRDEILNNLVVKDLLFRFATRLLPSNAWFSYHIKHTPTFISHNFAVDDRVLGHFRAISTYVLFSQKLREFLAAEQLLDRSGLNKQNIIFEYFRKAKITDAYVEVWYFKSFTLPGEFLVTPNLYLCLQAFLHNVHSLHLISSPSTSTARLLSFHESAMVDLPVLPFERTDVSQATLDKSFDSLIELIPGEMVTIRVLREIASTLISFLNTLRCLLHQRDRFQGGMDCQLNSLQISCLFFGVEPFIKLNQLVITEFLESVRNRSNVVTSLQKLAVTGALWRSYIRNYVSNTECFLMSGSLTQPLKQDLQTQLLAPVRFLGQFRMVLERLLKKRLNTKTPSVLLDTLIPIIPLQEFQSSFVNMSISVDSSHLDRDLGEAIRKSSHQELDSLLKSLTIPAESNEFGIQIFPSEYLLCQGKLDVSINSLERVEYSSYLSNVALITYKGTIFHQRFPLKNLGFTDNLKCLILSYKHPDGEEFKLYCSDQEYKSAIIQALIQFEKLDRLTPSNRASASPVPNQNMIPPRPRHQHNSICTSASTPYSSSSLTPIAPSPSSSNFCPSPSNSEYSSSPLSFSDSEMFLNRYPSLVDVIAQSKGEEES